MQDFEFTPHRVWYAKTRIGQVRGGHILRRLVHARELFGVVHGPAPPLAQRRVRAVPAANAHCQKKGKMSDANGINKHRENGSHLLQLSAVFLTLPQLDFLLPPLNGNITVDLFGNEELELPTDEHLETAQLFLVGW